MGVNSPDTAVSKQNPRLICHVCGLHYLRCECFAAKFDAANERAEANTMPHLDWFFKGYTTGDKQLLKPLRISTRHA